MAQPVLQPSFNSGEWAPTLYSRVDLAKYHSGAAKLRNFYVDYRGGASTRVGTRYILRGYKDSTAIRLIPFQASLTIAYTLEFGDQYIRFHSGGAPVLETALTITGISQADPCVITVANTYNTGDTDWVYVTGIVGMTELNGKYFIINVRDAATITIYDLFGNAVDSSAFTAWSSGGTVQRVYTVPSPYSASDLALVKFVQNVNSLIMCHPDYAPQRLIYTSTTNWAIGAIVFGTTIDAPTGVGVATTLAAGSVNYSYVVTSVDIYGQESAVSTAGTLASKTDIRAIGGTNTVSWTGAVGAESYNVYRADVVYSAAVAVGAPHGYVGNTTGVAFTDSNILPDFSQPPPTVVNPFAAGSSVNSVTITGGGSYTATPTMAFTGPATGATATAIPLLRALTEAVNDGGTGYNTGDTVTLTNGVVIQVDGYTGLGIINAASLLNSGSTTALPSNPVSQISTSGGGTGAKFDLTWEVYDSVITNGGSGYASAPTISFSAGAATATCTIGDATSNFPSVPAFFQQRLALAAPYASPDTIYYSRPGHYFNYDVSVPSQANDAITASIIAGQLNAIKALVPQAGGLIALTNGASFLINGGSLGSAITPSSVTANTQSFLGCSDVPPLVINYDILYIQSKGSSIRDSSYNFYANVFTGEDVSIISSHLFFGYSITEWCWAEEPYKIVWAIRNDGTLLSFTFLKEQEFQAWAYHDTENGSGSFLSVTTIAEAASVGYQNFVYTVVSRTVNSVPVKYIEYFPERATSGLVADAWCVDSGLQYDGSPATSFTGGEHLVGKTCTGLADGEIIPDFVMDASGDFTLATAASKVTVGIAYTPQLKTLPIDIDDPTIQGKVKKIPAVTIPVVDTLGLQIGPDFDNLVAMKDLVVGNVSSALTGQASQQVTDLVTGYAKTELPPTFTVPGQYCFQQSSPFPATVLGVFPELVVGDTAK